MRFATYLHAGAERVGVVRGETIHPVEDLGVRCGSMLELIDGYTPAVAKKLGEALAKGNVSGVAFADAKICAPIPHPRHDILCVGQNYTAHAIEAARFNNREYTKPDYPCYFTKRVNRAVGCGEEIPAHADITDKLDYEGELAVIIGRECSHVAPEEIYSCIFGYTIANDVSARNLQYNHQQYTFGKGLDGFAPMGPVIVTRDELPEPPHLNIRTWVNGEKRQDSNTADFIFDIPYMLSQLSQGITLYPGDILITGTPSGVGMGFQPPKFLGVGDTVEIEIEGIGRLCNTVGK